MKNFTIVGLLLFLKTSVLAQNICTNGGFETYTSLPSTYAQTCYSSGWFSASGSCSLIAGTGSPDYYNTSGSGGAKPPATWWATVSPHTGSAIMGFVTYYAPGSPNYREYIERPLSTPMAIGVPYSVSLWLTNGISTLHNNGSNNIGVYFSTSPVAQSVGSPIIVTPQVEISSIVYSTTWQQFTLSFTPTQAYTYMTIGNFHNDAGTSVGNFGANLHGAYYYIDDIVVQPAISLPVELIDFSGKEKDGSNFLHWETATEVNSAYFIVERSEDGIHFDSIGIVSAKGYSTSLSRYDLTDQFPATGIHYYRLKEVDLNGSFKYSDIIHIKNGEHGFSFFPNPTNGKFLFTHPSNRPVTLHIYSAMGQSVYHDVLGEKQSEIDISALSKGIYFIRATDGDNIYAEKILLH